MKVERKRNIKEAKSFKEQIEILKSRNIIIENDDFVINILKRVNYYRLRAYMLMHKILMEIITTYQSFGARV